MIRYSHVDQLPYFATIVYICYLYNSNKHLRYEKNKLINVNNNDCKISKLLQREQLIHKHFHSFLFSHLIDYHLDASTVTNKLPLYIFQWKHTNYVISTNTTYCQFDGSAKLSSLVHTLVGISFFPIFWHTRVEELALWACIKWSEISEWGKHEGPQQYIQQECRILNLVKITVK